MKKLIGICIPCYNEEGNIRELYNKIQNSIKGLREKYDFKILFIDNKSCDGSRDIIREICQSDKDVKAIFNSKNFGPDRSGAYGFYSTPGDAVITLACDLQDPPSLIPTFIEKWEEGFGVVLGKKTISEESGKMYATRGIYYKIMSFFIEDDSVDQITGFGIYDRKVVDIMKSIPQPIPNFRYLIAELGFNRCLIEYKQEARKSGISSYRLIDYIDTAIDSLVNNSYKPLRLLLYVGFFMFVISLVFFVFICVVTLFISKVNSFVYILFSILFILLSLILLALGGIGEYIGSILRYNKKLPLVHEEEKINF